MRWRTPRSGQQRIVRRLIWWPRTIGYETRWLVIARVRQHYISHGFKGVWADVAWADETPTQALAPTQDEAR